MLEKSEVKFIANSFVGVRHPRHQLEPKIAAGSHHILIVSDRSASQTLWNGRNVAAHRKPTPIVQSIAKFRTAIGINVSKLAP